ncbi:hypothetical protein L1987_52630 [Smallanthus sonchifolius]|uniref:Uncharacterized protein n=1 Tax=Smallanthus sonchifolius TaxID=185202 RepID=A0ACB9EUT6_9ASTR|nr:hypothetical protein L1987_52630 [Smallanthus sonchifolius]
MGSNDHYVYAMQLVTSASFPMVLETVIKLKVLEAIAEAGSDAQLTAHEIVSRLLIPNKDAPDMVDRMLHAIVEGGVAYEKVHGILTFEYSTLDATRKEAFNNAMLNHTTIVMKEILECYNGFNNLESMVDVGGGLGITTNMIVTKHPNIKGINFDLPHVTRSAPFYPGYMAYFDSFGIKVNTILE